MALTSTEDAGQKLRHAEQWLSHIPAKAGFAPEMVKRKLWDNFPRDLVPDLRRPDYSLIFEALI